MTEQRAEMPGYIAVRETPAGHAVTAWTRKRTFSYLVPSSVCPLGVMNAMDALLRRHGATSVNATDE